jgi:hypothetical protein
VPTAADMTVSVTIHKGNMSGFAKLEENVPNGVVAVEGDKQGASFTFVDNTVKFVWLSLPSDSVFTISYKLTMGSTMSGSQSITGEFSYLQDNNAMKYAIPASSFNVESSTPPVTTTTLPANTTPTNTVAPVDNTTPPVTTTTPPANTTPTNTVTPVDNTTPPVTTTTPPANTTPTNTVAPVDNTTPPVTTTTPPANTTPTNTVAPVDNTTPPVTTTPPPVDNTQVAAAGSVMYRVQIMALHNPVRSTVLSNMFKISEKIYEEMIDGFTKYTVGHFNEYKATRDHREDLRSKGVAGPFVVAYNGGKRITVQEALMITHQQWYK